MRSTFALTSPRALRGGRSATRGSSTRARDLRARAYTVTLKTPDGEQKVEVDEDTYILDAAEVRRHLFPFLGRS